VGDVILNVAWSRVLEDMPNQYALRLNWAWGGGSSCKAIPALALDHSSIDPSSSVVHNTSSWPSCPIVSCLDELVCVRSSGVASRQGVFGLGDRKYRASFCDSGFVSRRVHAWHCRVCARSLDV
jgi:hypothetical protein